MDHPNGHPCPECGAPRHADNTPSCACTRRAADALRDARTAEAAAAEDFDPLRIRPYVELSSITPDGSPEATEPGPQAAGDGDAGSPGATMTFKAARPDAGEPGGVRAPEPAGAGGQAGTGVTRTGGGATGASAAHAGGRADDATPHPAATPGAGASAGAGRPTGTEAPHTGAAATGASAAHPGSRPDHTTPYPPAAPGAGGPTGAGAPLTGATTNGAGVGHTGGPAADATPGPASAPGAGGSVGTGGPAGTEALHTENAATGASAAHPGSRPDATTRSAGTGASRTGTGASAGNPAEATPGSAHHASAPGADQTPADVPHPAPPDATMTLRAVRPDGTAPGAGHPSPAPAANAAPAAQTDAPSLPTPLAPGTAQPNADDLGLFDDATRPLRTVSAGAAAPRPDEPAPRIRRRRGALIVASGAAVAVLGAAGWASGLFSYDTPSRNTAAPDDVRAGLPDASATATSAEPSSEPPPVSPGASASVSDSPSASASASGPPSPSASSSAPSASASDEPSATPSAEAESSAPAVAPEPEEPVDTAPVLRRGDRGPEVVELQQRLRQVWLYQGDMNGQYGRRVEEAVRHYQWSRGINEELGVYGPQTRARLEAETGTP
ncbi:peptidoglycan-binding protein [Streptomyces pseudogriseolus]|uniref:peptidoglycan-binding domain-containing protein n=1 Tax=Streptomyces pseudogriseolus TaxID=36817 RepID=UPI003FA23709